MLLCIMPGNKDSSSVPNLISDKKVTQLLFEKALTTEPLEFRVAYNSSHPKHSMHHHILLLKLHLN